MRVGQSKSPLSRLNPVFDVRGEKVMMVAQLLAAIPASALKEPVTSLAGQRAQIIAAVDFLLAGV